MMEVLEALVRTALLQIERSDEAFEFMVFAVDEDRARSFRFCSFGLYRMRALRREKSPNVCAGIASIVPSRYAVPLYTGMSRLTLGTCSICTLSKVAVSAYSRASTTRANMSIEMLRCAGVGVESPPVLDIGSNDSSPDERAAACSLATAQSNWPNGPGRSSPR